jgi:hypothetical protein
MPQKFSTIDDYIRNVQGTFTEGIIKLRNVINQNIPSGFSEEMNYGMIGWVVPHSVYPPGYHCTPSIPLPFINIAAQKNFIALYHMGLYSDPELHSWFMGDYLAITGSKPDMGKSCVRFKKPEKIPFSLIGQLVSRINPEQWIAMYEKNLKR